MSDKAEHIIIKVSSLFRRFGIKSVTMDDVANHLGISKKTLYELFISKEDLIRQVLMYDYNIKMHAFLSIEEKKLNSIEELYEVYKLIKDIFRDYNPAMEYDVRKYYPSLFAHFREIKRAGLYELSVKNLNKGKREGLYRKQLNVSILARLHVFRVENIPDSDLFSVEELTSFRMFHQLFMYHLNGILSREGRKYLETNIKVFSKEVI